MATLKSLELPEIVHKRLAALAEARGVTEASLAIQALQDFTGSPAARRAILQHRKGQSFAQTDTPQVVLATLAGAIEQHWKKARAPAPGSRTTSSLWRPCCEK